MLNYQDIKIFNKNGYEIPLISTSNIIFTTSQDLNKISDDDILLYGYYDNINKDKFSTKIVRGGKLNTATYNTAISSGIVLYAFVDDKLINNSIVVFNEHNFKKLYYTDNSSYDYSDDKLIANEKDKSIYYTLNENIDINIDLSHDKDNNEVSLLFPSAIFFANIDIEKVSVGLVETETLIFGKIDNDEYVPLIDTDENGYDLHLFINSNTDSELSFLSYDNLTDEITRNDSDFINCNEYSTSQYSNIGFFPTKEGVYKGNIHVCLINRTDKSITRIGQLNITGVAVGEDERYNALFDNFGIQHPKTYYNIFKEHDILENNINWDFINKKSKELFLTYDQIFPYVGTYKALVNAVKYLGYDDIYFREWYKVLKNDKNISYRIDINDIFNEKPINNDILNIKKLNKLSMIYKLNSETGEFDEYNIPIVKNSYNYSITSVLTKLIALKDWLHRNIISINCKISDITGEGIVYEKVDHIAYGSIMQNIEFEDTIHLSPSIKNTSVELIDGSANIEVTTLISSLKNYIQLDEIKNNSLSSFDNRATIEYPYIYDFYVKSVVDTSNSIIHDNVSNPIWINEGQIYLTDKQDNDNVELFVTDDATPQNLYVNNNHKIYLKRNGYYNKTSKFINPPLIHLESAFLRNTTDVWSNNIEYSIMYSQNKKYSYAFIDSSSIIRYSNDNIILQPKDNAEFKYTLDNIHDVPLFILKNYQVILYNFDSKYGASVINLDNDKEYIIDIRDGKIINNINDTKYTINFNYEYNRYNKQNISVIYEYINKFSYDEIISEDNIYKNINVNHQGHYNITVYAYKNGNIYAKAIERGCDVKMPQQNISLITYSPYHKNIEPYYIDGSIFGKEINNLVINEYYDNNYPIFRQNYMISNLDFDHKTGKNNIYYDNITYANDIAAPDDYLQFINISDKIFDISINNNNTVTFDCKNLKNIYPTVTKNDVDNTNDINLIIYNKLLQTGIKEFDGVLESNNENKITIKFSEDDIKELKTLIDIYNDDYNIEYYINPINIFEISNISFDDDTKQTTFMINNGKNIDYFSVGDLIKLSFSTNHHADASCYYYIDVNGSPNIIYSSDNIYKDIKYNIIRGGYFDSSFNQYYKLYDSNRYTSYKSYTSLRVVSADKNKITVDGKFNITNNNYDKIYYKDNIDSSIYPIYYTYDPSTSEYFNVLTSPEIEILDKSTNIVYLNTNEVVHAKISHAHQAYTKYILKAKDSSEYSNGTSRLSVYDNRLFNYLDKSFSFIISKFNYNNAFNIWNYNINETEDITNKNDIYKEFIYKDYITVDNNNVYIDSDSRDLVYIDMYNSLYEYTEPITIEKNISNALYITATSDKFDTIKTYWKLYKRLSNNDRMLIFEVMNDILQLRLRDNGVYDIEAYSCDSNGNLSISKKDSIFVVI